MMTIAQADREFLEEGLPQLQDYLLSKELYWALGSSLPRLTPGNVLLALTRLETVDAASAGSLRQKAENVRDRWRSAWEQKISRETENRLRLWSQFLAEQKADEVPSRAHYATAVRERAILQLLGKDTQPAPQLAELDTLLRARFLPGPFVWDEIYQNAFPPDEFWFLYGSQ